MGEYRVIIPSLRQLRAFLAVARQGSMSKAGEEIFVSQSAVSQSIVKLERLYASRLIERRLNGVAITPLGSIVRGRFERALSNLEAIGTRWLKPCSKANFVSKVTIPQLRALVSFRDIGSFAAASRATGQAKSTLQRAARGVERALEVKLFIVDGGRLELNRKGEIVATLASYALNELENAYFEVREHQGDFSGIIRIGALPWVRGNVVPRAIVEITRKHTGASLNLVESSYDDLVVRLLSGQIDIMIGALRGSGAPSGVHEHELFKDQLRIIARREHPIFSRGLEGAETLLKYPWVLPVKGTPIRRIYDYILSTARIMPAKNGLIETGSSSSIGEIVKLSNRLTIASPLQLGFSGKISESFRVVDAEIPNAVRSIGVTTRSGASLTALQQDFINELSRAVSGWISDES